MKIPIDLLGKCFGGFGARALLVAGHDALWCFGRLVRAYFKKKRLGSSAFSRFRATLGPPGLDYAFPGRSQVRIWRAKNIDFRALSLFVAPF